MVRRGRMPMNSTNHSKRRTLGSRRFTGLPAMGFLFGLLLGTLAVGAPVPAEPALRSLRYTPQPRGEEPPSRVAAEGRATTPISNWLHLWMVWGAAGGGAGAEGSGRTWGPMGGGQM